MTPSALRWADFETCSHTVPLPVERALNVGVLPTGSDALFFGEIGEGRGIAAPTLSGTSAATATRMKKTRTVRMTRTYTETGSLVDAQQRVVAGAPGGWGRPPFSPPSPPSPPGKPWLHRHPSLRPAFPPWPPPEGDRR